MKATDFTHLVCPDMPVYPGTEPPMFEKANTLEKHGFTETKITMYSHTGTHIDAPAHLLKDGRTLDTFAIENFIGNAMILDFSNRNLKQIEVNDLTTFEPMLTNDIEFIILKTGWSQYWATPKYYDGFPYLTN
ncbi:MAG: cyclase family protein, partial [Syntrophomonas sp.]